MSNKITHINQIIHTHNQNNIIVSLQIMHECVRIYVIYYLEIERNYMRPSMAVVNGEEMKRPSTEYIWTEKSFLHRNGVVHAFG